MSSHRKRHVAYPAALCFSRAQKFFSSGIWAEPGEYTIVETNGIAHKVTCVLALVLYPLLHLCHLLKAFRVVGCMHGMFLQCPSRVGRREGCRREPDRQMGLGFSHLGQGTAVRVSQKQTAWCIPKGMGSDLVLCGSRDLPPVIGLLCVSFASDEPAAFSLLLTTACTLSRARAGCLEAPTPHWSLRHLPSPWLSRTDL